MALTEQSTGKDIQTKRWKLHYNEAGEGYPVIMLHGTGPGATGWSNFSRNVEGLSGKYRMIALDSPGWGGSDIVDGTFENRFMINAEAVKLLMDELGLEKAALVGNSMGGAATLQFCASYPERLSHMITMGAGFSPSPNIFVPGGLTEGIRIIVETYKNPTPENFRRLVSIMVYDSAFVTDELCKMRSDNALKSQANLDNWLKSFGPKFAPGMPTHELQARLAAYKGPSLFVHGRDDRVVPMEGSMRLVSLVENSALHIFNKCGHWAQIEHAEAFNALIDGFLQANGVTPSGGAGSVGAPVTGSKEKAWGG
ncbi:alpha/beta fold hydrolase [Phenylobacterium immobile]|uniref:alpha/beta fold hydrolase n=1 Tax=Phenylobacterium immobile TaxID=21 RepID=UPI000AE140E4|nr:alpha/beta hydrolase [Phenylobacterium immobile]